MADTPNETPEEFAPTRDHEYQDSHYHDEAPDIVNDEFASQTKSAPPPGKKPSRRPPPRPRYYED